MSRPDGYLLAAVPANRIIAEVARGFNLNMSDIVGSNRERHVCVARACAMAVVRESTGLSYPVIGRIFNKDHTTVMHNVRKVLGDPVLAESVRLVVDELSPPARLFSVPEAS